MRCRFDFIFSFLVLSTVNSGSPRPATFGRLAEETEASKTNRSRLRAASGQSIGVDRSDESSMNYDLFFFLFCFLHFFSNQLSR